MLELQRLVLTLCKTGGHFKNNQSQYVIIVLILFKTHCIQLLATGLLLPLYTKRRAIKPAACQEPDSACSR